MNFHKNHWLLFSFMFFGFIGLAFIVGIGPALWVQRHSEPLPGAVPLTALERQGLDVYVAEGCIACHTQQVRPLEMDRVWGRPSTPGDYAFVTPMGVWSPTAPAVLGSARTGPDLSNVGARQANDVWQYLHLYNPRSVVQDSVMPAYPWLFDTVAHPGETDLVVPVPEAFAPAGSHVVATDKAKALVAYLLSRRQVPLDVDMGAASSPATTPSSIARAPARGMR